MSKTICYSIWEAQIKEAARIMVTENYPTAKIAITLLQEIVAQNTITMKGVIGLFMLLVKEPCTSD